MPRKPKRSTWGGWEMLAPKVGRVRYRADIGDGRGYVRHSETVHGTARQVESRLAELRAEYQYQQYDPRYKAAKAAPRVTLRSAYERWWLPDAEDRVAEGSYSPRSLCTASGIWAKYVCPRWGDEFADAISPLELQEWLLTLGDQAASKSKALMRQVLVFCVRYRAVSENVADGEYRMPKKAERRHVDVYTVDELRDLAMAVMGAPFEGAVLLSAFGSARVGESLGVKADEVRLIEARGLPVAVVPIVRQVDNNDGHLTERLKTKYSKRSLVLPGPPGVRLATLARLAIDRGDVWLADRGDGTTFKQGAYIKAYRSTLEASGVRYMPPGQLRNAWETYSHWVLRIPGEMIEKMMGHSGGGGVTPLHYDRPDETLFAETVAEAYLEHPFANDWDFLGHN